MEKKNIINKYNIDKYNYAARFYKWFGGRMKEEEQWMYDLLKNNPFFKDD